MNVVTPSSLFDALRAKDAHPDARALAGGTDLFAQWQAGAARPETVIALERVPTATDCASAPPSRTRA